ncbi:MAG: type I-E CRISPR-associated protein Cas7/Cse4/CasC [Methylococcaceae bacterium]
MNDKNFINFHILISHSPSCLNRDDMNMQKSAIFGGKRRVRISSQSLKRAMRKSDYYLDNLGSPSVRSRELGRLTDYFLEKLQGEFSEDAIKKAVLLFVQAKSKDEADEDADGETETATPEKEGKNTLAVAPWCIDEIRLLCPAVQEVLSQGLTEEELKKVQADQAKDKQKKTTLEQKKDVVLVKKIQKTLKEKAIVINTAFNSAVDIALSGRMATSGLMSSIDGALAVAHAITTHAVDADIDWFTAVDDLLDDAGEVGAAHLNTQEFSAGVFYRYASLNLKQLQMNLGLIPDMNSPETQESRGRALEIARHVLHLLATVVPSAKQQTFAAHNLADFALVSFSDIPVSLANAFEAPVKEKSGGFLAPSIAGLATYWQTIHKGYGLDEIAAYFALRDVPNAVGLLPKESLQGLEEWIAGNGKA